jgi:hypothetical protein
VNQLGFLAESPDSQTSKVRKSQDYPYTAYGLQTARGDYLYTAYRLHNLTTTDEEHRPDNRSYEPYDHPTDNLSYEPYDNPSTIYRTNQTINNAVESNNTSFGQTGGRVITHVTCR